MAISTWPSTLPPLPLHSGYDNTRQSGIVRDDNYTGIIHARRRFTAVSIYHKISVAMTKAQFLVFRDFFDFTIVSGTLPFYYVNPILQLGSIKARIKTDTDPYSVKYDTSTLDYMVTFVLEELPGTVKVLPFDEHKATSDLYYKTTSDGYEKITTRI